MSIQRLLRALLVLLIVGGLTVTFSRSAAGECVLLDPWPSFSKAVPSAKTVFVGTVTHTPGGRYDSHFRVRVDEVLRGSAPTTVGSNAFVSGLPSVRCDESNLMVRKEGERLAFALDARLPSVNGRIDAVAFVGDSKPSHFFMPKMEQLPLTKVRRLAGLAADGSTIEPRPSYPTEWPLTGFATEEVEPGVLRVLSDGYRELSHDRQSSDTYVSFYDYTKTHLHRLIEAAPDGSMWVLEDGALFRLGEPETYDLQHQPQVKAGDDIDVGPDGTLWRVAAGQHTLRSFDGDGWQRYRQKTQFCGVEVEPLGMVWTLWWSRPVGTGRGGCDVDTLGRWDGTRWRTFRVPRSYPRWVPQFAATGNGTVWLCCSVKPRRSEERPLRFDGVRWKVMKDPAPMKGDVSVLIDGWSDSTLWMRRSSTTLARYSLSGWRVFTSAEDGVPDMGHRGPGEGFLRAGPMGSVWVTTYTEPAADSYASACDGLGYLDGTTWTRYLRGDCIYAIDIAPDGTAWVQAAEAPVRREGSPLQPIQTYVIHPGSSAA